MQDLSVSDGLLDTFYLPEISFLKNLFHMDILETQVRGLWMALFTFTAMFLCLIPENNYRKLTSNNALYMLTAAIAFIWAFLCLGSESVFVYFNF